MSADIQARLRSHVISTRGDGTLSSMKFKHILCLFALLGFIFLGIGFYLYQVNADLVSRGTIVKGEVIKLQKVRGDGVWSYQPIVKYRDYDGVERTLVSNFSTNPPKYFVGETLEVIYDSADPKPPLTAKIYDRFSLWAGAVFMLCFGGFFIVLSAFMWRLYSRGGAIHFGKKSDPSDGYDI